MITNTVLLGTGPMAVEYSKILNAMHLPFKVIGRSDDSVKKFQETTGIDAIAGGYERFFADNKTNFTHAIIAVGEKKLGEAARAAIDAGILTILVEKPGGIDSADIRGASQLAADKNAQVLVGYNRRFYASVEKAKSIIAEDGGVLSFNFEFTEWGHVIESIQKEEGVKENWFLANSSHVIDLAFHLGGAPQVLNAHTSGSLSWHPNAAIYAGAGVTKAGALFSYQANWQAPGRWALEILTRKNRLYFRPIEQLKIQKLGSVALEDVILDDALDCDFKPGLFKQTEAFFNNPSLLPSIEEQVQMLSWYEKINSPSVM